MKLLIGSDVHVNENKRLQDTIIALAQVLGIAETVKPDALILLGDIFDRRRPTPKEMQVVNRWLMNVTQVTPKVILLEGNHDQDNGISSLSYIKDLNVQGVEVATPPIAFPDAINPLFYLGHEQIDGALVNNVKLRGGQTVSDLLNKYPSYKVFAFGHFHKPQVMNNDPFVFYAGSLTRTNFSERDDQKVLWYFEDEKLVNTFPLATRPMFQFDVNVSELPDHHTSAPWEGKDLNQALVKIVYTGTRAELKEVNEEGLRNLMKQQSVKEFYVKYDITDTSNPRNENLTESITEEKALEEYFRNKDMADAIKYAIVGAGTKIIKEHRK